VILVIPELSQLLKSSIEECLEDKIAIAFSGGVDSTLIAKIASGISAPYLFTVGVEGSEDLEYSEKVASQLKLPLEKIILDEKKILSLYEEIYPIVPASLLKVEILIPIYAACLAARKKGFDAILFGSGAEELFVGYQRYYTYLEEGKDLDSILKEEFKTLSKRDVGMIMKVSRKCTLDPRFPFLNRKLADFVFAVPLEKRMEEPELKKGLLREAAKLLGVPDLVIKRKKKAAQYGSGVHRIVMKHDNFLNEAFPDKLIQV